MPLIPAVHLNPSRLSVEGCVDFFMKIGNLIYFNRIYEYIGGHPAHYLKN